MKYLDECKIVKIKKDIKHQNIGDELIRLERVGEFSYIIDKPCSEFTIAELNFIYRLNQSLGEIENTRKIYYGHLLKNNLGYFIMEGEFDE